VALDANGDVAAGTVNGASPTDLYVYRPNGDTAVNTYCPVPADLSQGKPLTCGGLFEWQGLVQLCRSFCQQT
jgi:hypothetical protein